jgi:hypothetical protein
VDTRFEDHLVAAEFDGVVLLVFWFEDGYTAYAKCMRDWQTTLPGMPGLGAAGQRVDIARFTAEQDRIGPRS